jgi:hypothetical protein
MNDVSQQEPASSWEKSAAVSLCRDLMLPQSTLSFDQFSSIKIETGPTTCLTDKGEEKMKLHRQTEKGQFLFLGNTL